MQLFSLDTVAKFYSHVVSLQKKKNTTKNVSLISHVLDYQISSVLICVFYLSLQVCIRVLLVIFAYLRTEIEPGDCLFVTVNEEREKLG